MKFKIKIKPSSNKQEIKKISQDEFVVSLKSKPENNKANIELIKLMKRYLGKDIKIIKGMKSKNKIVEVK